MREGEGEGQAEERLGRKQGPKGRVKNCRAHERTQRQRQRESCGLIGTNCEQTERLSQRGRRGEQLGVTKRDGDYL